MRLVEFFQHALNESLDCPKCGAYGAYVGFRDVECPNRNCPNFNRRAVVSKPDPKTVYPLPQGFKNVDKTGKPLEDDDEVSF